MMTDAKTIKKVDKALKRAIEATKKRNQKRVFTQKELARLNMRKSVR